MLLNHRAPRVLFRIVCGICAIQAVLGAMGVLAAAGSFFVLASAADSTLQLLPLYGGTTYGAVLWAFVASAGATLFWTTALLIVRDVLRDRIFRMLNVTRMRLLACLAALYAIIVVPQMLAVIPRMNAIGTGVAGSPQLLLKGMSQGIQSLLLGLLLLALSYLLQESARLKEEQEFTI